MKSIQENAIETIQTEYKAIEGLLQYVNADFEKAVEVIHQAKGRVVISGIGKSAIIAQKIVATLNSTGTPSIFLHAADAIHGDLGMMQENDVAIVISKSGESPEIKMLVSLIKNFGNTLIGLCGNMKSNLAIQSDIVINSTVEVEACPNNLAPTSSTTAQMVMGDALAVCLLQLKGFSPSDFARYHPGGALGKQLYMRVHDLIANNAKPHIQKQDSIKSVILSITSNRLGSTVVVDENNQVLGIITDGDIRRMLEKIDSFANLHAVDIMNTSPKLISEEESAVNAMKLLRDEKINQLVVINDNGYVGILHINDLIREGII
ncbi:MAG: KpsF/GutQ family sugar-phosphate isomerase [Chitinophagaceae bacterium]